MYLKSQEFFFRITGLDVFIPVEEVNILQGIEPLATLQLQKLIAKIDVQLISAQNNHSVGLFKGENPIINGDPVTVQADINGLFQ